MHIGTRLHWRRQFSPFGYASEWLYAEVLLFYGREPPGRLVVTATALPIGLPAAAYVLKVLHSAAATLWRRGRANG
jgi:hypothetical protein